MCKRDRYTYDCGHAGYYTEWERCSSSDRYADCHFKATYNYPMGSCAACLDKARRKAEKEERRRRWREREREYVYRLSVRYRRSRSPEPACLYDDSSYVGIRVRY